MQQITSECELPPKKVLIVPQLTVRKSTARTKNEVP
jgi:hypothetical protein